MNKVKFNCHQCNKLVDRVDHNYIRATNHFCSRKCQSKFYSVNNKGKNNPCYRHGMSGTRFYNIYNHVKKRCKDAIMYVSYLRHVKKYGEKDTTIDRIDNNKNYSKDNCRWATLAQQSQNTSRIRYLTYNNKTKSISEWARILGTTRGVLYDRLDKLGWTVEKTLTTKPRKLKKIICSTFKNN
ncbi:MAG: hypothetical protein H6743_03885 [Rickettsiaceae bacterium]|nr:hypothetical protein [Rickettsiaceae bacterium]